MLMHQKIDTLLPVNYAQFNTLLKNGLKKQGITVPYHLQVIRKEAKDSVLYAYTDASEKGESWKDAVHFTHVIEPEYYYELEPFPSWLLTVTLPLCLDIMSLT